MTEKTFPCRECGAELDFEPGSDALKCAHCGFENHVPRSEEEIREEDFQAALAGLESREVKRQCLTVRCNSCGAETSMAPHQVAGECPFCGSNIVAGAASREAILPRSLLPFKVGREEALRLFQRWLRSLWFAPGQIRLAAMSRDRLAGLYVPYWTYDCNATSFYRGERGDDYWDTETYVETENGRQVTKTRQVRKTRWRPVSGWVWNDFDDVLVLASRSLPPEQTARLEPWDLKDLVPYGDEYLSGFRAESYQVDLKDGFASARERMQEPIRQTVCRDIGGDHQRIHSLKTQYDNITFKHVLLPIWLSAYRYRDKVYRFLVNGRTGEVQGERPWSAAKVICLVLVILAAAAAVAGFIAWRQGG
jgi:DNA-directed RNA polymerase subunit RPC12/RpoP